MVKLIKNKVCTKKWNGKFIILVIVGKISPSQTMYGYKPNEAYSICFIVLFILVCEAKISNITDMDMDPERIEFIQYDALMDLYVATDGKSWKNNQGWGYLDPCANEWYGVNCIGRSVSFM